MRCQRILSLGLLTVYLDRIHFRLNLYNELFDLENFRFGSQKLHLAVKSNLGSLLWFHLSLSCQGSFLTIILQIFLNCEKAAKESKKHYPPCNTAHLNFLLALFEVKLAFNLSDTIVDHGFHFVFEVRTIVASLVFRQ